MLLNLFILSLIFHFALQMKVYFDTYEEFFKENMPAMQAHFKKHNVTPDIYLYDW